MIHTKADIHFKWIQGWISQSENHQLVFLEIEPIGKVAEHSHGAQWGVVLEIVYNITAK